jgi:thiamine biosynthesis lipoprotein
MSAGGLHPVPFSHDEEVMGTVVSFRVLRYSVSDGSLLEAVGDACARLHRADDVFSTWKPASPLSRLRRGEIAIGDAPEEVPVVLELCEQARELSGGWFDPWAMPGGVDPTGLVKGWAIEQALEALSSAGVDAAMVNGGGDIAVTGLAEQGQLWPIGIQHPWRPEALACVLGVEAAVATSGSYERGAHLVDPRSGLPTEAVASATVTGPRLALVDALATAVAVGGDLAWQQVSGLDGFDAYMIRRDGTEIASPGIRFVE